MTEEQIELRRSVIGAAMGSKLGESDEKQGISYHKYRRAGAGPAKTTIN